MTRINCVPVETLTNKHLMAEYKEITRPFNKVLDRIEKYGIENALAGVVIADNYILGKGHESFFFNKLKWLFHRHNSVFDECVKRGFDVDQEKFCKISGSFVRRLWETKYWNQWQPTPEDMYVNMARLCHRHFGEKVDSFK